MKMARTVPTTKLLAELKRDPRSPDVTRRTTSWATPMSSSDAPANGAVSLSPTCSSEASSCDQMSSLWLKIALATSAIIASYATVDAVGVREARHAGAYAAWVLVLYGLLLPATFILMRGRLTMDIRSTEVWKALAGGLVALVAYGAVVVAFALGPAGPISALRETSVVFAVLIGWRFLGETLTPRRIAACAIVAMGTILLGH